jgi:hypothetical protein
LTTIEIRQEVDETLMALPLKHHAKTGKLLGYYFAGGN